MTSFPRRLPTDAAQLSMIGLEQLTWPVTYTYFIRAPWGETQQHLTVEVPALVDNTEATKRLGQLLWGSFAAPAATGDVSMYLTWVTSWKAYGVPQPVAGVTLRGDKIDWPAPREETPQLVLLTGHGDDDGRRRWFCAGAPRSWVRDGLLTRQGFEQLLPHAAGCLLGLAEPGLTSGMEWLIAYPNKLEATLSNMPGVAFRRVKHVRVCHHTDRAPDPSGVGSIG